MKAKRKYRKPEAVKVGNVVVKVYPHRRKVEGQKRPYVTWQVADFTTGERRWQTFRDHTKAVNAAKRVAGQIASGDVEAAKMRNEEAASYGRAIELLRPTALLRADGTPYPLEIAAAHFAESSQFPNETVEPVIWFEVNAR